MRLRRLDRGVAGQLPDRKTSLLELEVAALRVVRAHLQQLRDLRAVHVRHALAVDADERPADLDAAVEGRRLADLAEDRGLGLEDQPQRALGRVDRHALHDCSPGALFAAPGPRRGARGLWYGGTPLPGLLCERGTASALRGSPWAKRFTLKTRRPARLKCLTTASISRDGESRDGLPGAGWAVDGWKAAQALAERRRGPSRRERAFWLTAARSAGCIAFGTRCCGHRSAVGGASICAASVFCSSLSRCGALTAAADLLRAAASLLCIADSCLHGTNNGSAHTPSPRDAPRTAWQACEASRTYPLEAAARARRRRHC